MGISSRRRNHGLVPSLRLAAEAPARKALERPLPFCYLPYQRRLN